MKRMILAIAATVLTASRSYAVDLTTCGQSVPDGETGVLQVDLDCSADPGDAAVSLGNRSTLAMNGHAIIGRHIAVSCGSDFGLSGCVVQGVGEISGGNYGISGASRRIIVSDVNVYDVAIQGVTANQLLVLTNVTVLHALNGIVAGKRLMATNIVASENEYFGISSPRVIGTDITTNLNGYSGVTCKRCVLTSLTADDNGMTDEPVGAGGGLQGGSVKLTDSTLTGNSVDGVLVDIDTFRPPRLLNTTCDHSRQRGDPSESWGVCAAD